jgi:hypothetical protein
MKKVFLLLLFFSFIFSAGHADPNINIVGALITNLGDIDPYVVTPVIGSSYNWSVSGGQIIAGQGTPIITVLWNTKGPGAVQVNIDNGSDIVIIDTNSSKN